METNPLLPRGLKPLVPLEKDPGWDRRQRHITKLTMEFISSGTLLPRHGLTEDCWHVSLFSAHLNHSPAFLRDLLAPRAHMPTGNLR